MSDQVWVTDALVDSEQVYHFSPPKADLQRIVRKNLDYSYLEADYIDMATNLPEKAYLERVVNPIDPLPHLMTNSFLFISQQLYDVLQGFELGKTDFSSVTLFPYNETVVPLDRPYFYVNITEKKKTFIPKRSKKIIPRPRHYNFNCRESTISVDSSKTVGVDLWMEPLLRGAVFVSDGLYQALQSSGLVERVNFHKCAMAE